MRDLFGLVLIVEGDLKMVKSYFYLKVLDNLSRKNIMIQDIISILLKGKNILKILTINSVVGIKGRIEIENNNIELVAERIKLF